MSDRRVARLEAELSRAEDAAFRNLKSALIEAEENQRLRSARTANATAAVRSKGDAHRQRAADLKAQGLSAPRIGIRMAQEEGRDEPYPERTVRKWLSSKKG